MLLAFMAWGVVMPRLAKAGLHARHMITWGLPSSMLVLGLIVVLGPAAGAGHWALWCVLSTCVSLSQPAVAQAFPPAWAGRALSAFNLVIFGGVFCLQWGIGLVIDALGAHGLDARGLVPGRAGPVRAVLHAGAGVVPVAAAPNGHNAGRIGTQMTTVLIIAHAPLASALRAVAQHAYPDCAADVQALDVPRDASAEQVEAEARALLARQADAETLVFTDVFGATPCRGAHAAAGQPARARGGRRQRADAVAHAVLRHQRAAGCAGGACRGRRHAGRDAGDRVAAAEPGRQGRTQ